MIAFVLFRSFRILLLALSLLWPLMNAQAGLEDRMVDESLIPKLPPSPDWSSIDVPPPEAEPAKNVAETKAFGAMAPAARSVRRPVVGQQVPLPQRPWLQRRSWPVLLRAGERQCWTSRAKAGAWE